MPGDFNKDKRIAFWLDSSEKDFKAMQDLYVSGNNHWALFMGHLVLEKLLKALFVFNTGNYPPLIHDLRGIMEKAGECELDDEKIELLDSITRFNISARYDDYKQSFYHLCTDEFTETWINHIKALRLWIKSML
ncbi:MAG: HEPN domain-containing protein [Thermodesulfobacteriota bacterium]|nr:HEPN domain-containing protein [Thermodesulfobacteriota bacterium]